MMPSLFQSHEILDQARKMTENKVGEKCVDTRTFDCTSELHEMAFTYLHYFDILQEIEGIAFLLDHFPDSLRASNPL
jgi:hypothetical protein